MQWEVRKSRSTILDLEGVEVLSGFNQVELVYSCHIFQIQDLFEILL